MIPMARARFDSQLDLLNEQLKGMATATESALMAAVEVLSTRDVAKAREILANDDEIDNFERDIESLCLKLLLQQQPVARDLRTISSALKMISDMERIGDQAEDIAELTRFTREAGPVDMVHIGDMARAVVVMVTDSVDAFVKKDLDLARKVMASDDQVDALFDQVKRELIQLISTDANQGELSLDLLMVAKYLERIGDHSMNIVEIGSARKKEKLRFSGKAEREIEELSGIVTSMLDKSIHIVRQQITDVEIIGEVIELESQVDKLCETLADHHVERVKNKKCTPRNGMLYLDMLNNLERIADHADNLASSVEPDHHDNRLLW